MPMGSTLQPNQFTPIQKIIRFGMDTVTAKIPNASPNTNPKPRNHELGWPWWLSSRLMKVAKFLVDMPVAKFYVEVPTVGF